MLVPNRRLGNRFALPPGSTLEIGRAPSAGVSLPEVPSLSRSHARLRYAAGKVSIEDLARMVRERTESASEITYTPYDEAYEEGFEDMPRRVPDLSKLVRVTGFRPATPLEEIVDRVAEHFRVEAVAAV